MGKFVDILRQKLQTIRTERREAAPDYTLNPNAAYEYMLHHNDLIYIEQQIPRVLLQELRKLTPEKQAEFYQKSITPEKAASMSLEQFRARLNAPERDGAWILSEESFGKSEDELLQNMEDVMGPEASDAAASAVDEIRSPRDPAFPADRKFEPDPAVEADLQAVRQSIPQDDPDREATLNMLQQVEGELSVVSRDVMEFYNQMDHETDQLPGLTSQMDQISHHNINAFVDSDTKAGLPGKLTRDYKNDYEIHRLPQDPQTINALQGLSTDVPENVKNQIREMEQHFDSIGENRLQHPQSVSTTGPSTSGEKKIIYKPEQANKMYAFWPLIQAKRNLKQAVRSRNLSEIRNAHNAYNELHRTYQNMMKTVSSSPNVYCGNLNSTRPSAPEPNLMPDEFVQDYAGHSKINGLFLLHGAAKNLGVSALEFVDKPIECMQKGADQYITEMGLSGKRSLASKLVRGLSDLAGNEFEGGWITNRGLCTRSLMAVAGLCEPGSPAAQQLNGQAELASTLSNFQIQKEASLWQSLTQISDEKKDVFYQHAALLPGDLFNLNEMAVKMQRPDWKKELDPNKVIKVLRAENMINYAELTTRTKEVLEQADNETFVDKFGEEQTYPSGFRKDRYLVSAHRAYLKLIQSATPEERERDDFKAFQKHVLSMSELTNSAQAKDILAREEFKAGLITEHEMEMKLDQGTRKEKIQKNEAVDIALTLIEDQKERLTVKKEGLFLSSTDSKEHQAMTNAVELFRLKAGVINVSVSMDDLTEKQKKEISQISVKEAAVRAWNATYAYINKSDECGKKTEWSYPAGEIRNKAARKTLTQIQQISDQLNLVTPAEREMMKLRTELHNKRNNEEWMDDHLADMIAKNMYLMTMHFNKIPPEKQESLLKPANMNLNLKKIGKDPAFKRMIENEGLEKLTQKMIEAKGGLSNAFIKAKKQIAAEQNLEDPLANRNVKKLTSEDRGEFWSKQIII